MGDVVVGLRHVGWLGGGLLDGRLDPVAVGALGRPQLLAQLARPLPLPVEPRLHLLVRHGPLQRLLLLLAAPAVVVLLILGRIDLALGGDSINKRSSQGHQK